MLPRNSIDMLPPPENLTLARRLALEALRPGDLKERARRSGARWEIGPDGQPRIGLRYLNREVEVSFPAGTVEPLDGGGSIAPREEILILHYLETAQGTPISGQWVSFGSLPEGAFYGPVFQKRVRAPLVRSFGENPEALLRFLLPLEGEPLALGDAAVKIPALPRVPIALVVWKGDEDFPPEGNILFDSTVKDYLPVEDMVVLAETLVWKLIKSQGSRNPGSEDSRGIRVS
jgi:hypothetical protein